MSLTLQSLRNMTLLQIVTLPEQELDRLYREAVQELNHASRCLKRLHNARYLRRLTRAREIVCSLESEQMGGDE
ncbi:MAG: hypothetical protein B0D91_14450 [Oceanospirillales bacterium LUC14_002_19_P2]|nr:MAG: hypothetical protein B0D91_14450 [Oceanospirillales bacterium LUC14_002_19_P2]